MTILIAPRWQPQMHARVRPSPFWLQLVHFWVGTSVLFSLVLLLSFWDFFALQASNTADQRQVHHLFERGTHWLWEQLCFESKTIQQILRRVSDFHRDLPINDLFLVITSRVRGEFLAGFLKNHRGQPAHFHQGALPAPQLLLRPPVDQLRPLHNRDGELSNAITTLSPTPLGTNFLDPQYVNGPSSSDRISRRAKWLSRL